MVGNAAKGPANEVRRIDHADNLFSAIFGAGRELQHTFDDIGDKDRFLAFPNQGFTGNQRPPAPN